jgi:hypothetical protein
MRKTNLQPNGLHPKKLSRWQEVLAHGPKIVKPPLDAQKT